MMETNRIILRPWRESDAEALFKYASDPDVGPRAGWPPHKSVEESLEVIRTIFHNDTLVGYWVGKPFWNQGICTEALRLMIDHIHRTTDIKSLISSHFIDNPASGRVMEKCGFVPTGETCVDESLAGSDRPMRVLRLEIKR